MKLSVENKIRIGFGAALALLLLTSAAAFWSATRSVQNFRSVEHTERVLAQLAEAMAGMVDVESGARGFALTGQESFLEPFDAGQRRARESLQHLRSATAGDATQQRNLDLLESLVNRRLTEAAHLVETRKQGGLEAATRETGTGHGTEIMDSLRGVIAGMEGVERRLLAQKSAEAETTFRMTMWVVAVSSVLAVVVVGVASVLVRRDFEKRRAAEEQRDQFFTLSLDLFCIAGFDGYFKSLNPAWEKTLGYSCEELMARPYMEFIHPDDRAPTRNEAAKVSTGQPTISFANRYRCKDGSYKWLLWTATPLTNRRLVYATAHDMTERYETQEKIERLNSELQQHTTRLEAANAELEAFSYSVSHDLRAPLRHIDGFVSRLRNTGAQLDEKSQRYLGIISDSARQMGNLIDDLLIFSRMGRAEMRCARVDLETLTREVMHTYDEEVRPRQIKWKNGNLPAVDGDPSMLKQVLVNLISNAVKYTRTRDVAQIEIGSMETANEVIVFVRDNGVGFEMEYVHKLFGVFQRLHRSDEFEGTGIGLANVRRIIHRHGGRTWAEGKINMGATFYFSLPKNRKEHRESAQTHSAGGR